MKENFRVTPVFTMPLARRVMSPEGTTIAGNHIPYGVSTSSTIAIDGSTFRCLSSESAWLHPCVDALNAVSATGSGMGAQT